MPVALCRLIYSVSQLSVAEVRLIPVLMLNHLKDSQVVLGYTAVFRVDIPRERFVLSSHGFPR